MLVLASLAVTLFPVAGTYYNNWRAIQAANRAVATQSSAQDNAMWLEKAHAYNDALPADAVSDPWTGVDLTKTPAYRDYRAQLAATDVIASLRIPAIHVTLPVRHGTSEEVLDQGAGHMFGSSLPVGGKGTHAALAAHRGLPNMTGFDQLPSLKAGDQFFVDVAGQTLAYKVTKSQVVLPNDTRPLARAAGKDQVTLITCTPYGINSHRLLVTGDRIPLSEADQGQAAWHQSLDWTIQPWMRMRLGLALAALLMLLGLAVKWARDDRRRARRRRALLERRAAEARAEADEARSEAERARVEADEHAARAAACTCGAFGHDHEHAAHADGTTTPAGDADNTATPPENTQDPS